MCKTYVIMVLSPPYVIKLHRLVKLSNMSHDIFRFIIYNKEKESTKIAPVNYLC